MRQRARELIQDILAKTPVDHVAATKHRISKALLGTKVSLWYRSVTLKYMTSKGPSSLNFEVEKNTVSLVIDEAMLSHLMHHVDFMFYTDVMPDRVTVKAAIRFVEVPGSYIVRVLKEMACASIDKDSRATTLKKRIKAPFTSVSYETFSAETAMVKIFNPKMRIERSDSNMNAFDLLDQEIEQWYDALFLSIYEEIGRLEAKVKNCCYGIDAIYNNQDMSNPVTYQRMGKERVKYLEHRRDQEALEETMKHLIVDKNNYFRGTKLEINV